MRLTFLVSVRLLFISCVVSMLINGMPTESQAKPGKGKGIFSSGRMRFSLNAGTSNSLNGTKQYFNIGGGFGYYVIKGLEVGIQGQVLFGSEPNFYMATPYTTLVWAKSPIKPIYPYIGAFYKNVWAGGGSEYESLGFQSLGARTGVYYVPDRRGLLVGIGVAYEKRLSCDPSQKEINCDWIYPEFNVGLVF
jgi:hypothetical protein